MMLDRKFLILSAMVIVIFALFAVAEVGAECTSNPECYSDTANDICFGNGVCDAGEAPNHCVWSTGFKQVIEICPDPVTGVFGAGIGLEKTYKYWVTNNSTNRRDNLEHGMQVWAECTIPIQIDSSEPANSVNLQAAGAGAYGFAEGDFQRIGAEINFQVLRPGDSGWYQYTVFPVVTGEISVAVDSSISDSPTTFNNDILGPTCSDEEPTTGQFDFEFSEVVEGSLVTCKGTIIQSKPPRVILSPDSSPACVASVHKCEDVYMGLTGEALDVCKMKPGQWINQGRYWWNLPGHLIQVNPE
jgi:hypothetical protein